ncbi:MAG: hypothetical protein ACR2P0_16305 [Acidimicrobiales bacterium]
MEMTGDSSATTTLTAGMTVCVYYLHGDPTYVGQNFDPVIDFNAPILGFGLKTPDLATTNVFEVDGTNYFREGLDSADTITATGSVLEFHAEYGWFERDQMRVFVGC